MLSHGRRCKESGHIIRRIPGATARTNRRRLRIEGLEDRRVLSATTAPQLIDVNSIPSENWEGTYASEPSGYVTFAGEVYFSTGGDVDVGNPWKTDGTAAGTSLVDAPSGIPPGGFFSAWPYAATSDELFLIGGIFDANAIGATGLWKIEGPAGVPEPVMDVAPSEPIVFNDELYFTAYDSESGTRLWKSDGTTTGTSPVADINPNGNSNSPGGFAVFDGAFYFAADDGASGYELWKSDGTEDGTERVADIFVGGGSSNPTGLTVFNGALYFSANDGADGVELWKTDGTELGTVRVTDINQDAGSSNPASLTVLNGELFFSANDGATGVELWKTDGTVGSAVRVTDINPNSGSSNPERLNVLNGELYFNAVDGALGTGIWKTNGAAVSRVPIPASELFVSLETVFNGELYFSSKGAESFSRRVELWKTDGTAVATERVTSFTDNQEAATIPRFVEGSTVVSGDTLIFTADDGIHGFEPWVIRAITPTSLASIIGDLPAGATELQVSATPADIDAFLDAIADLAPHAGDPIDVVLNLAQGDYAGAVVDVPAGYRVIINGAAGQSVFHGASPALTLQSGDLLVTGASFVNSTDASSIVVNGGSLVIRDSLLHETTGGARAAIEIDGGTANLGTLGDPGGNTIIVNGSGEFVMNATAIAVSAIGDVFQVGANTIAADIVVAPQKRLIFDAASGLRLDPIVLTVGIDLRPTSLNIDQNGAISLVIFGSSVFDVTQVNTNSLKFAGVSIDVFNSTLRDENQDGTTDLLITFRTSDALKSALISIYADLLLDDYGDDGQYATKENAFIALDGVFGQFGKEFSGSDSSTLFLAGQSLKSLLASLGI
jgi:ELWxxDGT repeat protein